MFYIPRRHVLVALVTLSAVVTYNMRVSLSVVVDGDSGCAKMYGWDNAETGIVVASFYIGYSLTQVLGGVAAARLGGMRTALFAVFWSSLMQLLSPIAAPHFNVLLAVRCSMGLGEGLLYPSVYELLSRWCPPKERSMAMAIFWAGGNIAIAGTRGAVSRFFPLYFFYIYRLLSFSLLFAMGFSFYFIFAFSTVETNKFSNRIFYI
jgi:MFS family permease